jgi:cyanophycinase-like exopeptidase
MKKHGRIALVGSGEYLPIMQAFESSLLALGPSRRYVQLATAAGLENEERINYWKRIGAEQADRMNAEQVFVPVFTRKDAMREDLAAMIDGAGMIYLSGGDPHHLAITLIDTPVWRAIERNWRDGASLAGCSAGAMALGPDIPNFRKMRSEGSLGLNLIPQIRTIPHYNKFFKWIPDSAAELFLKAPDGVHIVGIDEDTAISSDDLTTWSVHGVGSAHLLNGEHKGKYADGSSVVIERR